MRYVAFIDTLGFTKRITQCTHQEAVEIIRMFNQTIFDLWKEFNLNNDFSIRGRTFSDSVIIHTKGDSIEELDRILKFIIKLYRTSITICDLPLRGGLAYGQFDDLKAVEFDNLEKGLVVGTAFIEAYSLESAHQIKGSKLLFGQDINLKIERQLTGYQTHKVKNTDNGHTIYELKWGDLSFLTDNNYFALNKLVDLATKSKWLEHYYGTLETFLINESSDNKNEIYMRIIERINAQYKYNDLDDFIENYLKSENANYSKKSFLALIRERFNRI